MGGGRGQGFVLNPEQAFAVGFEVIRTVDGTAVVDLVREGSGVGATIFGPEARFDFDHGVEVVDCGVGEA